MIVKQINGKTTLVLFDGDRFDSPIRGHRRDVDVVWGSRESYRKFKAVIKMVITPNCHIQIKD